MMLWTLICFLPCVFATDSDKNAIIEDIIRSVERTLAFYQSNMRLITLDDVFALRLLEGQILVMNNKLLGRSVPASDDLPSNILPRLTNVYQYSRNLSSTALNLLYRNFKWRSMAKSYIYQWPWTFAASYRYLDTSLKWPADTYRSSLNDYSKYEEFCFAELMKSGFERGCSITGVCTRVMFTRGQNLHDIEQQLLYTLLTEQSGCLSELNSRLIASESVEKWQAELCTNIFFTVSDSILKNGNIFPQHLQGVFLKMALLCPFAGYMEFLHVDWLRQILSWQLSFGCWGSSQHSTKLVVKQEQWVDTAVHQKNEEASVGERYTLKADVKGAAGDFLIERNGMRRLQDADSEGIEQIQRRQRRKERAEAKQNRTVRKGKLQHEVTLMTTVFIRKRRKRNKSAVRTKEHLVFMSKKLLLTKTSDHSSLPLQEGCVSPLTAMAIGALTQYLRFCLLAPLSRINPVHYLFGTNYILSPDELSTQSVKVNTTQRTPTTAAGAVVRYGDRNLDHNFAEDGRKREVKDKDSRDRIWPGVDSAKSGIKVDINPVMMFDENNPNYEEGALALGGGGGGGAQDEDDAVDYSYPSDDLIKVVDVSRDFKEKDTKDRGGAQDGGYDSYYDNVVDEDNGGEQVMAWHLDHDRSVKLAASSSSSQVMTADSRFDVAMAVGKIYIVLLGVMFLFVWFLYTKLWTQRTGHQCRKHSHWKTDL